MHPDAPNPSPTAEDQFDAWLDAFVAGSSTPARETSASTSFAPAPFTAAQSAALQFHGLAASAEKANVSTAPRFSSYATDPTWEKILMNQQSPEILVAPLAVSIALPPPARRRRGTMQMINTGLSIAAVIALLIAASVTVWFNRDHLGFPGGNGGDDGPPSSQLAAVTMPNGDKVNVAYVVPTKNDCTVEPLTVDQVMAKLDTPVADGPLTDARATAIAARETPMTSGLIGTPLAEGMIPLYPLDEPTYDQLAATQREWLACAIYGSPLQRWALEANNVVQAEFQAAYMPFFDIEQIREDVEQLSQGGDSALFRLPALTGNGFLPMVPEDSNGWYNNRLNDNQSQITVLWMKADGSYLSNVDDAYAYYRTAGTLQQYLPNQWVFIKDPESGRWLLHGLGLGMG